MSNNLFSIESLESRLELACPTHNHWHWHSVFQGHAHAHVYRGKWWQVWCFHHV